MSRIETVPVDEELARYLRTPTAQEKSRAYHQLAMKRAEHPRQLVESLASVHGEWTRVTSEVSEAQLRLDRIREEARVRTQGLGRVSYGPAVVVLAFRRPLMPQTAHAERHFTAGDAVRDVVIGMSDGITVPFALTAGLSGAVSSTGVVVVAGLAEVAAGAIAMGLGGYLAARSDAEHYASERAREVAETGAKPAAEAAEVSHILRAFGLTAEESAPIVAALRRRPEAWVDFMMRFELGLENPDPRRALTSALTIGSAYVVGGLIPLAPYMAFATIPIALKASVASRLWRSGSSVGSRHALPERAPLRSALQTMLIGGTAAAAAFAIYRLDSSRRRSLAAGHSVRSRNRATIRGSPLTPYMNEDLQRQH